MTDQPDHTPNPEQEPTGRQGLRVAAKVGAAVAAISVLASSVVLTWLWKTQRDVDTAAHEARVAAERFAGVLTNIGSERMDKNFNLVVDGSTGEFEEMYTQSDAQLRQLLVENKAVAHGIVVESAVKSASTDTVEVLLFVDQSVNNKTMPEPQLDRSRVRMTMEKVDQRWLASKVELP